MEVVRLTQSTIITVASELIYRLEHDEKFKSFTKEQKKKAIEALLRLSLGQGILESGVHLDPKRISKAHRLIIPERSKRSYTICIFDALSTPSHNETTTPSGVKIVEEGTGFKIITPKNNKEAINITDLYNTYTGQNVKQIGHNAFGIKAPTWLHKEIASGKLSKRAKEFINQFGIGGVIYLEKGKGRTYEKSRPTLIFKSPWHAIYYYLFEFLGYERYDAINTTYQILEEQPKIGIDKLTKIIATKIQEGGYCGCKNYPEKVLSATKRVKGLVENLAEHIINSIE